MLFSALKKGLFVLIITPLFLHAQNEEMDSLQMALSKSQNDSLRVEVLNEISHTLFASQPDSAIYYGEKAKEIAIRIDFGKGLAYANNNIGLGYYMKGDFFKVLSYWEEALKSFQNSGNRVGESNLLLNIGAVYFNFGDDPIALDYYLKSLKVAEDIENEFRIYSAYVNIGTLYLNKEETHETALKYFKKAIPYLGVVEDLQSQGNLYANLGELYLEKEEYDSSIHYLDIALAKYESTSGYPHTLNLKGRVFREFGDFTKAINFQKQAVEIAEKEGYKLYLAEALLGLGETYLKQNKYIESIQYLKEAEEVAKITEADYFLKDIFNSLSAAYAEIDKHEMAYTYKSEFAKMQNKIYDAKTDKKIQNLQFTYEIDKKQDEINLLEASNKIQQLQTKRQTAISWAAGIVGVLILILTIGIFRRYKFIKKITQVLEKEKARSDDLLLNILPEETAEELKEKGSTEPKYYESATILFTDFKGFTTISAKMTPNQLVTDLHECFKMFDIITSRYGMEKIKTIGDAYMAAGGLPKTNTVHPINVAMAAIEIRNFMQELRIKRERDNRPFFEVRIGIHTGPVVAGVVGIKKFAYDIWGNTVNIASRMESSSEAGKVNISEASYQLVKDKFDCEFRGEIEAKNTGKLKMYFLKELKEGKLEPFKETISKQEVEYVS